MAIIAPFKGVTYNYYVRQDFERLVAPPYDVISRQAQEVYYQTDPYNVIRLILGKNKTGDSDWDNKYTRAADLFKRWEAADILLADDQPCIYVTSLTYDPGTGDPPRTRWGVIVLVRIEDPDSGVILPHERTFSAHKDDRLKLMRACNAQFSQIFGLYEDPQRPIIHMCQRKIDFPPAVQFDFKDGTKHSMWVLKSYPLFKEIADAMRDRTILIADGHHRYETALNYRDIMRARYGRRPANRSYEFVMMYLSNMSDEGLTILPAHRVVKRVPRFDLRQFLDQIGAWFHIKEVPFSPQNPPQCYAAIKEKLELEGQNTTALAFYHHQASNCYFLTLRPGTRHQMGDDLDASLQKLDVLALSRFLLQRGLGFTKNHLDDEELIHYESNMSKALALVSSGQYHMAFLLNPTKMEHVKEVASKGLVMPRKSTYFYPKVITGLVFNKIDPHGIINIP